MEFLVVRGTSTAVVLGTSGGNETFLEYSAYISLLLFLGRGRKAIFIVARHAKLSFDLSATIDDESFMTQKERKREGREGKNQEKS